MGVRHTGKGKREHSVSEESGSQTGHSYTLIVRLWQEVGAGRKTLWRGSVDCVQTGERTYFQTLEGLRAAAAHLLGEDVPASSDDPEGRL